MIITVKREYRCFDVEVCDVEESSIIQVAEQIVVVLPRWKMHQVKETDKPEWTRHWTWYEWDRDPEIRTSGASLLSVITQVVRRMAEKTSWGREKFLAHIPVELLNMLREEYDPWYRPRQNLFERIRFRLSPRHFELTFDEREEIRRSNWNTWENISKLILSNPSKFKIVFLTRDEHYGPYRPVRKDDYE